MNAHRVLFSSLYGKLKNIAIFLNVHFDGADLLRMQAGQVLVCFTPQLQQF